METPNGQLPLIFLGQVTSLRPHLELTKVDQCSSSPFLDLKPLTFLSDRLLAVNRN